MSSPNISILGGSAGFCLHGSKGLHCGIGRGPNIFNRVETMKLGDHKSR